MTFPASLDNLQSPTANVTYQDDVTLGIVPELTKANNAINALETKVGANSSAVTTTHDYKLSGVTGSDKAASKTGAETLTNKTLTTPIINNPTGAIAGELGYEQSTVNQTGITTTTDITNLSTTVTVPTGGRKIKITVFGNVLVTDAGSQCSVSIWESTTQRSWSQQLMSVNGAYQWVMCQTVLTPTSGNHTYRARCALEAGTGTVTFSGDALRPAYILVELI